MLKCEIGVNASPASEKYIQIEGEILIHHISNRIKQAEGLHTHTHCKGATSTRAENLLPNTMTICCTSCCPTQSTLTICCTSASTIALAFGTAPAAAFLSNTTNAQGTAHTLAQPWQLNVLHALCAADYISSCVDMCCSDNHQCYAALRVVACNYWGVRAGEFNRIVGLVGLHAEWGERLDRTGCCVRGWPRCQ